MNFKKNEKGITLTSLILYVLIITAALALLANLSQYITRNLKKIDNNSISSEEFNKFNSNFVKDIKESNSVVITSTGQNYTIVLSNGANYNYYKKDKSIYKNYHKIAQNICFFTAEQKVINNKKVVKVKIGTGKNENNPVFGKTINYVLKYW